MLAKPVLMGLLGSACLAAAAGGAYIAVRDNAVDRSRSTLEKAAPAVDAVPDAQPAPGPTAVPAQPAAQPAGAPIAEAAPTPAHAERRDPPKPPTRAVRTDPVSDTPGAPKAPVVARAEIPPPVESVPTTSEPIPTAALPPAPAIPDVVPAPEPAPVMEVVEVTIPSAAVIGLQIDRPISSETANVEDRVEARVTRDVMAGGQLAIPAGSRAIGAVMFVERGGKVKETARLGIRFHTVVLADGTRVPVRTETIVREGDSPGADSARKIGGAAVGGAILGAILGGGKGAMIGGATGAAGGTAAVMAGGRSSVVLPAGTILNARLSGPVSVQVEKEQD